MKSEIGHYRVNGNSFGTNKVLAVLEAQKTNSEVEWYFFDDELSKVNWKAEPVQTLDQLYKMRAMQIRIEYDYVILFLSGGADSNNMARTFLNNGIHIDEVVAMIPESGISNYDWNDKDISASNLMSETKYAQYPILNEVKTKSPSTKITVYDFFDDMVNMKSDSWIYNTEGDIIDIVGSLYGKLEKYKVIRDMAENGKRIASVWATDKPILAFSPQGDIFFVLADSPTHLPKYPFETVYPNVDRVLFYYTHQLPELMVKQAHVVAREVHKPENKQIYNSIIHQRNKVEYNRGRTDSEVLTNMFQMSDSTSNSQYSPKNVYQRGIVPFIYPSTYDKDLFQARKYELGQTFMPAFQNWIPSLHSGTRIMEMITSDFSLFYKNISQKYLNSNRTGFKMCIKQFKIGSHSNFLRAS